MKRPANKKINDDLLVSLWGKESRAALARRFQVRPCRIDAARIRLSLPKLEVRFDRPWTPEDDEMARTLPGKVAARRIGVSISTLTKRRRQLGLNGTRVKRIDQALLASLWGEEPAKIIADRVGACEDTVQRMGRRMGLRRLRRAWTAEDRRALVAVACERGVPAAAKAYGVSELAAKMQLWRAGASLSDTQPDLEGCAVAALLGVHRTSITNWRRRGLLPKAGRISPKAVRKLVLEQPGLVNLRKVGSENWPDLVALLANKWG